MQPPPELSDWQNSLNHKASKKVLPKIHYANKEKVNYRPPLKPPYILNVNGEVIGIIEKENLPCVVPKPRPLPKPPRIHGNDDREGIMDPEKEHSLAQNQITDPLQTPQSL